MNWRALPPNIVKIKVDVVVFIDQTAFGAGIVIQNFRGHVPAAKHQNHSGDMDAKRAEAIVAKKGLLLA